MAKALSLVSLMALWARIWLMSVSFSCTFIIAFQKDLLSLVCGAGQAGGTGRAVRAGRYRLVSPWVGGHKGSRHGACRQVHGCDRRWGGAKPGRWIVRDTPLEMQAGLPASQH